MKRIEVRVTCQIMVPDNYQETSFLIGRIENAARVGIQQEMFITPFNPVVDLESVFVSPVKEEVRK